MSASVVQSAKITGSTGTTSTATIAAPTVGNTLLVMVTIPTASSPITTFADNLGNTYPLDHSGGGLYNSLTCYFYRKSNLANAPTSLSVTGTTGSFAATFEVIEVAGLDNASPLVSTKAKTDLTGGASSVTHTASITTSNTSDFVFMMSSSSNSRMLSSADGGYAVIPSEASNSFVHAVYLADAGEAGAKSTLLTYSLTTSALILGVVYEVAKPSVTSVSNETGAEGSTITHTVTLSSTTAATTGYSGVLTGVTANTSTDLTSTLLTATLSNSVTFSAGNFSVPSGVSSWTVALDTTQDGLDEVNETYTLYVDGTVGTGSITDDDAPPTVSISDATESFGTVTHTLTLSQASGKTITVQVDSANGSKTAGTHYTAITAQTVTFNPGETEKTVTVTVL